MKRSRYTSLSEINVTNLVDVTMVLLIIFMITAPLLRKGMEVQLPKSNAADVHAKQGTLVSLNRDGIISIDDERVSPDNFATVLLKKYSARNQQQVMLQADKAVPYGKVIELMDKIKSVGINNLGLIVEPDDSKK